MALPWFRVEREGWGHSDVLPTLGIVGRFLRSPLTAGTAAVAVACVVFAAVTSFMLVRNRWPSVLAIYSLAIVGLTTFSRLDGLRPRDVFTATSFWWWLR